MISSVLGHLPVAPLINQVMFSFRCCLLSIQCSLSWPFFLFPSNLAPSALCGILGENHVFIIFGLYCVVSSIIC